MSNVTPEPSPTDVPGWTRRLSLALALGLTLLFFHRAVFSADVFFLRDVQHTYVPLWEYWRERVLGGGFPQWYPFDGLGEPYVGMVISGAFHPAQWLSLVLPGAQGLKWLMLLCFPVAFLGVSALGRRFGWGTGPTLVAAVNYTFSGYLVGITNNPLYLLAAVTVPWVLWALEGHLASPSVARGTGAAVLLALVLLSGDVQGYAVCLGGVLLWSVCREAPEGRARSLGRALGVSGVSVLLSAVQILPTLKGLGEVRASGQTAAEAMVWSVHPLRLLELFLGPLFAGESGERVQVAISQRLLSNTMTELWVDSLFIGAPALVLAGVAVATRVRHPRAAVLAVSALGVLLLALGKHAGLYGLVFEWVPPWRSFRYPEKLMPFVTLCVALAAGLGSEWLERTPTARRRVALGMFGLGALVLGMGGLEWSRQVVSESWLAGLWTDSPSLEAGRRIGGRFVLGCGLAGVSLGLLGGIFAGVRSAPWRAGLLGALCFVGLLLANGQVYKVGDPELFEAPPPFVLRIHEALHAQGGPPPRVFRLPGLYYTPKPWPLPTREETDALVMNASLMPLVPALFGLESASTHLPAVSQRVLTLKGQPGLEWVSRTAALFNTRYFVISREFEKPLSSGPHRVVERLDAFGLLLMEDPGALPRVYLAWPRCVASAAEAVRRLKTLQAPREVVVECTEALPEPALDAPRGEVRAARFAPERVELEVEAKGGEVVVLNDAFYSGWSARVDGQPVPILAANGAVRAVAVPPGAHRVVFSYQTPGLIAGLVVSLGTLLALLGLGLVVRRTVSR